MARRKSTTRRSSTSTRTTRGRRKSDAELRVEQFTWALLVVTFAITQVVPAGTLPNWFVPLAGAFIILGSGWYQYSRRWRVSPFTWIAGSVMALLTYYVWQVNPAANMLGAALLVFAGVILFGVMTGET
ncbi:MAG: hypothetical protein IAE80_04235 [Anaerolinea sp.]|nr:hypothetical protein [Anaerolinea sp.]